MLKIGFIDYYLDEWHANNYPGMIARRSAGKAAVTAAYAMTDSPRGGLSTAEWCQKMRISRYDRPEELIAACDGIVVLSPDNPEMHWTLCQEPLRSGKRVFVDKTFAPDADTARGLFALARENHTPMYSSSALRFARELAALPDGGEADFIAACGPGVPENYLIHQLEPVICVMKASARRLSYLKTECAHHFDIEFAGEKRASVSLLGDGPFAMTIKYRDGQVCALPDLTEYFDRFLLAMLRFFETGEGAVPEDQTIAVAALIEVARKAMEAPGEWAAV